MKFTITSKFPDGEKTMDEKELMSFAERIGLTRYAPERFCSLFVWKIYAMSRLDGIAPNFVIDQVRALEGAGSACGMKPATQFKHAPLAGLYHQHFFAPQFLAQNMLNQLGRKGIEKIFWEVAQGREVMTEEILRELSTRLTVEQFEQRADQQKLTGEWIVFAKHNGQNYYLTISRHTDSKRPEEDKALFWEIDQICYREFPFLSR